MTKDKEISEILSDLLNEGIANSGLLPKPVSQTQQILKGKRVTYLEAVLTAVILQAIEGNVNAAKLLFAIVSDSKQEAS